MTRKRIRVEILKYLQEYRDLWNVLNNMSIPVRCAYMGDYNGDMSAVEGKIISLEFILGVRANG